MEKPSAENERVRNPVSCPRCQSSNTKFCYYNNHNVNQPRHFCRDCQRYWTAGGSLRNVPIGAGKRKHKGPHVPATKPEDMASILSFHSDQGVYTPSLESSNVLSFKQPVAHNCEHSKLVEAPCAVPQAPLVTESKPQALAVFTSRPHVPAASYDALSEAPRTSAFVCPQNPEKPGFTDLRKQPSLSLGLNVSKEAHLQKSEAKRVSHINSSPPHLVAPQQYACSKQESRPAQYNTEGDDSTGCSSVTTNLGPSVMEAVEVSTKSTLNAPTIPAVEQATNLLNPMVALGMSMCPPWVWPFIMGGHNGVPPPSLPQVDPAFAAATIGAMASMPPINPALTAAMGAMASSGRLPQIDPSVMAAVTASFLQFPHIWSPYTWGLPFTTPWNMTSAVLNAPNGVSKRPASPSPEECGQLKSARREHLQETSHSTGLRVAESVNAPNYPYSTGYFDAFRAKPDVSTLKSPVPLRFDQRLNSHQQRALPHLNPAAEARSAAFQEGN